MSGSSESDAGNEPLALMRQLQEAVESFSDGFALLDADDRFVWASEAYKSYHGHLGFSFSPGAKFEDLVRRLAEKGFYDNDPADADAVTRERLERHARLEGLECQLPDGEWVEIKEFRTRDGGIAIVRINTTERRQNEERIREAMAQADHANRAKSEFLANMSHELRTPLNSIIGFAEILNSQIFGPLGHDNYADYANDIRNSGKHLLDVISDILDIAKIESDHLALNEAEMDLVEAAQHCVRMVREPADAGQIILSMESDGGRLPFYGDEVRIKQVILNLLANAIKFTKPMGRVRTSVTTEAGAAVIKVADTGIGIAARDMPRVIAPFQQIRNVQTHSSGGTGLGVHLSIRLVEMHGGTLAIDSSPGEGTTVTITFPPERLRAT